MNKFLKHILRNKHDFVNSTYVEEMFLNWKKDPNSVHSSWNAYFKHNSFESVPKQSLTLQPPANLNSVMSSDVFNSSSSSKDVLDHLKVQLIVRAYQARGHQLANLDPLEISLPGKAPELEHTYYGFTESDLDRTFQIGQGMLPGFLKEKNQMTLREIINSLKNIYCGKIGIEYSHIPDRLQCDWLRSKCEVPTPFAFSVKEKRMILDRLIWSDSFEKFVASKWSSEKRFGLEGCEALIPGMKALIDHSVENGVKSIVIGMPHRGRLNVLSNVVRKPNESIFSEFSGAIQSEIEGGDVKYHLGMNYIRPTPSGKEVHLSLVANPSHLEAVNPVVEGKVRAELFYANDLKEKNDSMAVLLHGDAAFSGQGVVYETLGFCELPSYSTGGTIHIVVNNQVGFTTDPRFSRSTPYCTDVAKTIHAPIFHVNGDDVESVVHVCQLAVEWRKKFKKDVVIDINCYRRYGHNEIDQPSFTQPLMYKKIARQKPALEKYVEKLVQDGTFSNEEIEKNKKSVWAVLEKSYVASKDYKSSRAEWVSSSWPGFKSLKELSVEVVPPHNTGINLEVFKKVGNSISSVPEDFRLHPNLSRILKARKTTIDTLAPIDWATAEQLAFGSLLEEGKHVRLSGQDVERGTFSHRHAVLHDQEDERQYVQLNNISKKQAHFTVCNSSLSEFGTLGFELGYSLVSPNSLVMWEAQFGDFANNAQCIIDQFIAAGERKWLQRTGLTMLLPHGYDGAGPEHSSARMERFLQLCDDHPYVFPPKDPSLCRQIQDCNMQVLYCSTPANYFHALRRQIHRDFRKPLILFNSKSLLRHPLCKSPVADLLENTRFQRLIPETQLDFIHSDSSKINKVIFCSGQVYYALLRTRELNQMKDIAIVRIEQISPLPSNLVFDEIEKYPNAEIVWAQEEPMNAGAWSYIEPRFETVLKNSSNKNIQSKKIRFAGREPTGSVATGNKKIHVEEEINLLGAALLGESKKPKAIKQGFPVWN